MAIFNFLFSKDGVEHQQPPVTAQSVGSAWGGPLIERRRAKRFQADWQIRVEASSAGESAFIETGVLQNISAGGALLSLTNAPPAGAQIDVYIRLPFKGKQWMKYPAQVVRIELGAASVAAAVRFNSPRPDFAEPLVSMST